LGWWAPGRAGRDGCVSVGSGSSRAAIGRTAGPAAGITVTTATASSLWPPLWEATRDEGASARSQTSSRADPGGARGRLRARHAQSDVHPWSRGRGAGTAYRDLLSDRVRDRYGVRDRRPAPGPHGPRDRTRGRSRHAAVLLLAQRRTRP